MIYKRKGSDNLYMDFQVKGKRVNRSTGTPKRKLALLVEDAARCAFATCCAPATAALTLSVIEASSG